MRFVPLLAITLFPNIALTEQPAIAPQPRPVVFTAIESSLPTATNHIRQYAFDGDAATYFATDRKPIKDDHITLRFDEPVVCNAVQLQSGLPNGENSVAGKVVCEASADGKLFEPIEKFLVPRFAPNAGPGGGTRVGMKALRFRFSDDLPHTLVIREIVLDTTPRVVRFRHPIEFTLDVSDAPEMKEWGEKVVRVCERQYPSICDELASPGFVPPTQLRMTLKNDYAGVAAAGGGKITGSVKYFKSKPDDIGAMVHETVHCVQLYRGRNLPGWLVEGIADYYRFWRYEPGKAGRLTPERARYDGSYRTTAAFLAFVSDKYDPNAVTKLNAALRENKYDVGIWKTLTGKTVEELNQEWRQSLVK